MQEGRNGENRIGKLEKFDRCEIEYSRIRDEWQVAAGPDSAVRSTSSY